LTNGQAVMHYSRHRLTALVAYVTTLTYASTNDQLARPVCPLVSSSKTKPCQFGSVQLRRSARALKERTKRWNRSEIKRNSIFHFISFHFSSYYFCCFEQS